MYVKVSTAIKFKCGASNRCVQRPQFGLLQSFTSWSESLLNLAFVRIRFKLFGCLLFLIIVKFDTILFLF